ncbi:MAG TPA: GGDEF domain-containing protein [Burkholderiaceae bacterium]|nr:GGDEF domain-containing protein [Burkholderiaceae bacterium]
MQATQTKASDSSAPNPVDVGFEVLRRLAVRRIAPTPDAYRALYDEIAGAASDQAEAMLARLGKSRARTPQDANSHIRALESRLEQLNGLVCEDQLTGSLNRRGLDHMFSRELGRANRCGTPLCVAMLDLDDFKQLNDTYGHCTGDDVLVHVVRVIKQTLRSVDNVARFGGEEFLILLPDTTLEAAGLALARLQQALAEQVFIHKRQRLPITFSAGVALRAANEGRPTLVARADAALYRAKQAGKNRVVRAA